MGGEDIAMLMASDNKTVHIAACKNGQPSRNSSARLPLNSCEKTDDGSMRYGLRENIEGVKLGSFKDNNCTNSTNPESPFWHLANGVCLDGETKFTCKGDAGVHFTVHDKGTNCASSAKFTHKIPIGECTTMSTEQGRECGSNTADMSEADVHKGSGGKASNCSAVKQHGWCGKDEGGLLCCATCGHSKASSPSPSPSPSAAEYFKIMNRGGKCTRIKRAVTMAVRARPIPS